MTKKISKGKPIEELVKGSMDYTMRMIRTAFEMQFPWKEGGPNYYVDEVFADHVIVKTYGGELKTDEYFMVSYSRSGEAITFAGRDAWEIVELTYQPQTTITESKKKSGMRLEEAIQPGQIELLEAKDEAKGTRRIRINELIVANVVNGNKRLYEPEIIEAMVADWQTHLRESAGQGRLKVLTGEADHPTDKGKKRTEFLETVVRWDTLDWDGKTLNIEGDLILTSKGRDVEILMEAGVTPGGSIRGIGESKIEKVNGQKVEKVLWLSMNGVDLVGDPSFKNSAALQESINQQGDFDMNELLEQLKKLLAEQPELFNKGMTEAQLEALNDKQLKKLEESLRTALGIDANANIIEAVKGNAAKAKKFDALQEKQAVDAAITEATKDLPFGKDLNEAFTESIKDGNFDSAEAVKTFAESQRKVFGKLASGKKLQGMGFNASGTGIQMFGSVLENETGTPEFARGAFEIAESIRRVDSKPTRDWHKVNTVNEEFAKRVLSRFDVAFKRELMLESKMIEEAGTVSDLNLPYSTARAVTEEAFPDLISSGIFDFDVIDTVITRLYFEAFSGETNYAKTVTDEVVAADHGAWVALANQRLTPGSVVVTNSAGSTTYTEDTDYLIDYANGKLYAIASGAITDAQSLKADYGYTAIRKGEMLGIERGKLTLSYITVEAKADRLADQISKESILFAQAQMGWDVRTKTLANLAKQMKRKIDQGAMYMALSAAKTVASNVVGTWTAASDTELAFVKLMGKARVKVAKRFYDPTFGLLSTTNADLIANWDGFTAAGKRPDADLKANGYIGRLKGLAIFDGTEFSDGYGLVGNRELVQHRVFKPMSFQGPLPSYDSDGKVIAAEQYYAEEFNLTETPVPGKGSLVKIA